MSYKEKRTETLVGAFVLFGLATLALLVIKFGHIGDSKSETYHVDIEFKDASGLLKGSEVRMGGAKIGRVLYTPKLTDELTVMVRLSLDDRIKIYKNSKFMIQSISLLGDKMIVIIPPEIRNEGDFLVDGSRVSGGETGGLEALQSDAESVARDARQLMKDARTSLLKFDLVLDDIKSISGKLGNTIDRVNNGLLGNDNVVNLRKSLINIEATTHLFKDVVREFKPTLQEVRAAVVTVKDAANSAELTFATATKEIKNLSPAVEELPATINEFKVAATKLNTMTDNANAVLMKFKDKDGLLATLSSDKEVNEDVKSFIKNLKQHGLLGYKDESTYDQRDPKKSRYRGIRN